MLLSSKNFIKKLASLVAKAVAGSIPEDSSAPWFLEGDVKRACAMSVTRYRPLPESGSGELPVEAVSSCEEMPARNERGSAVEGAVVAERCDPGELVLDGLLSADDLPGPLADTADCSTENNTMVNKAG